MLFIDHAPLRDMPIHGIAFSRDGAALCAWSPSGGQRFHDAQTGRLEGFWFTPATGIAFPEEDRSFLVSEPVRLVLKRSRIVVPTPPPKEIDSSKPRGWFRQLFLPPPKPETGGRPEPSLHPTPGWHDFPVGKGRYAACGYRGDEMIGVLADPFEDSDEADRHAIDTLRGVHIWNWTGREWLRRPLATIPLQFRQAWVDPTGDSVFILAMDGPERRTVHRFDTWSNKLSPPLGGPWCRRAVHVAFSADGNRALAMDRHFLDVVDCADEKILLRIGGRSLWTAGALSADGELVLTSTREGDIEIRQVRDGSPVQRMNWEIGHVSALAASPDGCCFAAGSTRGRMVLWDAV